MTQSIESMIEVLQAYKDGKVIEWRDGSSEWTVCHVDGPAFNFHFLEYRIAPEPKRKVKLEAWLDPHELRLINPTNKFMPGPDWIRVPSLDMVTEI